jgi:hypothetical protein
MVAYEFYQREEERDQLIGILPERRINRERITEESIMKWVNMILVGTGACFQDIYFIQVEL